MSKVGILLIMWFVGFLHFTKYANWAGRPKEGYFWVFTDKASSQIVRASRYILVLSWLSSFLVFFALDTKIVLAIFGSLLFASSSVLSFRDS